MTARIVSGLLLAAAGLVVAFIGGTVFAAFIGVALVLIFVEADRLVGRSRPGVAAAFGTVAVGACLALAALDFYWLALVAAGGGAGLVPIVTRIARSADGWRSAAVVLIALVAGLAVFWLREAGGGWPVVFWLFAVLWATDTGAYVIGRIVRGALLAPVLSPNKTWAGALGGLAAGIGSGVGGGWLIWTAAGDDTWPSPLVTLPLAAVLSIAGQLGDLAESALKRHAGLKDSGRLIPGHGGVLDRLDSMLVGAPVLAVVVYLAGSRVWGGS